METDLCFGTSPVFSFETGPPFSEIIFLGDQNVSIPFHVDISPAGRVVVALRDILIFNRVPKTASLNIFTILEGLRAKIGFDIATR